MAQCLMSVLMQKPDYARARPSTLLEDDTAYAKLFHPANDLNTYYYLASVGRIIEQHLKASARYSTSEINDIRFYVLYAVIAILVKDVYPKNSTICKLQVDDVREELLTECVNLVYDLYRELGGDDKVAKGQNFSDALKEKLRVRIGM